LIEGDDPIFFPWENINGIDYDDQTIDLLFRHGEDHRFEIPIEYFGNGTTAGRENGKLLSLLIGGVANRFADPETILAAEVAELSANGKWDQLLQAISGSRTIADSSPDILKQEAIALHRTGKSSQAVQLINQVIADFEELEIRNLKDWALRALSEFHELKAQVLQGRNLIGALRSAQTAADLAVRPSPQLMEMAREIKEEIVHSFVDLPYGDRKALCIVDGGAKTPTSSLLLLDKEMLPKIKFPIGHPVPDQIYIGHPYEPEVYFPIQVYEEELYQDKFMELNYLLQCLGAVSLSTSVKTDDSDEKRENRQEYKKGSAGINSIAGKASLKASRESAIQMSSNRSMECSQSFEPKYRPYVPCDLIWFPHELTWQRLVKQRMTGGLQTAELIICSRDLAVISSDEKKAIVAEFKTLVHSGDVRKNKRKSTNLISDAKLTRKIEVTFAPIETLLLSSPNSSAEPIVDMSDAEQEYLEMVNDCLEDGVISDDERRLLDRRLQRLGISRERGEELEAKADHFSLREAGFAEEVRFCLEDDGRISPDERRILKRLREKLSLTEERANEIEHRVVRKYCEAGGAGVLGDRGNN